MSTGTTPMRTKAIPAKCPEGARIVKGVHQCELMLHGESRFVFPVVEAYESKGRFGFFRYEIWEPDGTYRGYCCLSGQVGVTDVPTALSVIGRTYKDHILPPADEPVAQSGSM